MSKFCRILLLGCAMSSPLHAEDAPKAPSPEEQAMMAAYEKMGRIGDHHRQLAAMVGNWTYENTMWMDPSAPPEVSTGTSESKAIWDGRYIETLFHGDYNGQPFEGRSISGYDNLKGKYVSTWIDSMSTGIFISYGEHDPTSNTTVYRGEMDDPMNPGKITPVRQVYRWTDADHHVFEWYETHDGVERKTMEIKYARKQ
jgi:hypothetical protein